MIYHHSIIGQVLEVDKENPAKANLLTVFIYLVK